MNNLALSLIQRLSTSRSHLFVWTWVRGGVGGGVVFISHGLLEYRFYSTLLFGICHRGVYIIIMKNHSFLNGLNLHGSRTMTSNKFDMKIMKEITMTVRT